MFRKLEQTKKGNKKMELTIISVAISILWYVLAAELHNLNK